MVADGDEVIPAGDLVVGARVTSVQGRHAGDGVVLEVVKISSTAVSLKIVKTPRRGQRDRVFRMRPEAVLLVGQLVGSA